MQKKGKVLDKLGNWPCMYLPYLPGAAVAREKCEESRVKKKKAIEIDPNRACSKGQIRLAKVVVQQLLQAEHLRHSN
jgi:hypothetical protein